MNNDAKIFFLKGLDARRQMIQIPLVATGCHGTLAKGGDPMSHGSAHRSENFVREHVA